VRRPWALALVVGMGVGPASASDDPALDYMLNCQGCHRADGSGTEGSVPALSGSVARFLAIPEGRDYLARVPGVAQAALDDDATAALLNWIVRHFDATHVPAEFQPYTGGEIGRLRRSPLVDVERTRARLLAEVENRGRSSGPRPTTAAVPNGGGTVR
jgi:cytochrome c553